MKVICNGHESNCTDPPLEYHIYSDTIDAKTGQQVSYPVYRGGRNAFTFYLSPVGSEVGEVTVHIYIADKYGAKIHAMEQLVIE